MRLLSAGLALLVLTSAACSSGSDVTGPSSTKPLPNGSMSAKFGGADWSATASVHASSTNGIIGVAGTDINQTLAFALSANAPGTYNIGQLSATNAELTTTGGVVWVAGGNLGSGTITITSLTATAVAGTFSFNLVKNGGGATISVTSGVFNIKL